MNESTSKLLRRAIKAKYNPAEAALLPPGKVRSEYKALKRAVKRTPRNHRGKVFAAFATMIARSKMRPVELSVDAK